MLESETVSSTCQKEKRPIEQGHNFGRYQGLHTWSIGVLVVFANYLFALAARLSFVEAFVHYCISCRPIANCC